MNAQSTSVFSSLAGDDSANAARKRGEKEFMCPRMPN